jgi:hypothetical protein
LKEVLKVSASTLLTLTLALKRLALTFGTSNFVLREPNLVLQALKEALKASASMFLELKNKSPAFTGLL